MAALSADCARGRIATLGMYRLPVATLTKIYAGSLVSVNTGGYAIAALEDATTTGVMGVAKFSVDNSLGADGALFVDVEYGTFEFKTTDGAITDIGLQMYVVNDNEIDSTAGANSILAGICIGMTAAGVCTVFIKPGAKK